MEIIEGNNIQGGDIFNIKFKLPIVNESIEYKRGGWKYVLSPNPWSRKDFFKEPFCESAIPC